MFSKKRLSLRRTVVAVGAAIAMGGAALAANPAAAACAPRKPYLQSLSPASNPCAAANPCAATNPCSAQ